MTPASSDTIERLAGMLELFSRLRIEADTERSQEGERSARRAFSLGAADAEYSRPIERERVTE
jgi:hypothetical protein